jgi:hypothetical protein
MMLYVFLVVLAGQTCIHTTKENLLFGNVHIIKESNVVFDESVFPFAILNPNASKRLQKDILLFPPHTSSTYEDAHIDDYMSLPVVPNVTNFHPSHTSPTAIQQTTSDTSAENNTDNDDTEPSSGSETDDSGADSQGGSGGFPYHITRGAVVPLPEGLPRRARSASPVRTLTHSASPNTSLPPSPSQGIEENVVHSLATASTTTCVART